MSFPAISLDSLYDYSPATAREQQHLPHTTSAPSPNSDIHLEGWWASYYSDHAENPLSSSALRFVAGACRAIGLTGPKDFYRFLRPAKSAQYEHFLQQFLLIDQDKVREGFEKGAAMYPDPAGVHSLTFVHPSSSATSIACDPKILKCELDRNFLTKRLNTFCRNHRTNREMAECSYIQHILC